LSSFTFFFEFFEAFGAKAHSFAVNLFVLQIRLEDFSYLLGAFGPAFTSYASFVTRNAARDWFFLTDIASIGHNVVFLFKLGYTLA